MDATLSIRSEDPATLLYAQRACFTPSDRELSAHLPPVYGRGLDRLGADELATARLVFAQIALLAGAALAADSETFVGAEHLWREMQAKIGPNDRALAKRLLEALSRDEYYSESERCLIARLARTLPSIDDPAEERPHQSRRDAATSGLDEGTVARLQAQRDTFAPSKRELTLLLRDGLGCRLDAFLADEVATARTVFAQVVLMRGAALAGDAETYVVAERLWSDMQDRIGSSERKLARRLLDLLSHDAQYSEGEQRLIESLARSL